MFIPSCCQLPVFRILNFGASVKSAHFDFAPLEQRMSTLPYPHRHDFFHAVWITHGRGSHIIDDVQYEVRDHALFFMGPGQVHDFRLSSDARGYSISFSAEFYTLPLENKNALQEMPFFAHERPATALYLDAEQAATLQRVVDAIAEEYYAEQPGHETVLRSLLTVFFAKATRMAQPQGAAEPALRSLALTRRFKALLEQHFHTATDAAVYAQMLGITERALNDATRRTLGTTANKLIRERVMLEAKRMLLHSQVAVAEIADRLSFDDPAYFSRCFKKHTGRSPMDYRLSLEKLQAA